MALVSRIHYEAAATASSILKAEAMNGQGLYIVCSVSISSMTCRKGTALSARVHIKKSLIKKKITIKKRLRRWTFAHSPIGGGQQQSCNDKQRQAGIKLSARGR
jgi:hypothetical protein